MKGQRSEGVLAPDCEAYDLQMEDMEVERRLSLMVVERRTLR